MSVISLVLAGGVAAGVSWLALRLLVSRAERLGLMDVPNARSTHRTPTPRGGGIGILAGIVGGLLAFAFVSSEGCAEPTLALLATAVGIGGIGLMDDRRSLPAGLRLALQVLVAVLLVSVTGPLQSLPLPEPINFSVGNAWVAGALTILWLTAITNFFNFMDGVDGLAGGQAIASSVGIAIAGWSAGATSVAVVLAGASVGFLAYNWPPARLFMGDVGSGAIGFLLAGLPLLAPLERRADAILAVSIGLAFFVLDPLLTLARRAIARKPLMQAHREHLYQRLILPGTSGVEVTAWLLAGAGLLAIAGALSFRRPVLEWTALGCAAVLFLLEWNRADRALARIGATAGKVSTGSSDGTEAGR